MQQQHHGKGTSWVCDKKPGPSCTTVHIFQGKRIHKYNYTAEKFTHCNLISFQKNTE